MVNFYELEELFSKMSKKNLIKWEVGPYGTRNSYQLMRLDNRWIFGNPEIGMEAQLNAFKQTDDTYEQYEMEFYKKWHDKELKWIKKMKI